MGGAMTDLLVLSSALLAVGVVSALFPVINAEVAALSTVPLAGHGWPLAIAALTLGQTAGKLIIYGLASGGHQSFLSHRGSGGLVDRLLARVQRSSYLVPAFAFRVVALVKSAVAAIMRFAASNNRRAFAVISVSAVVSVPPLVALAALAGVMRLPIVLFAGACFMGRLLRFGSMAFATGWAAGMLF